VHDSAPAEVELHPSAQLDVFEAAVVLEEKELGLGDRFVAEVARVVDALAYFPASGPRILDVDTEFRVKRLVGFPYRVFYSVGNERVSVLVVVHERRSEEHWRRRLGDLRSEGLGRESTGS